ncbi:DUF6442 family protein [Clostridium estertheticum]|uniref:DUF6442 family protein n=1 Tax=Clostridium estertheticum TaxID=238834 RepID=UPI001C7DC6B1|nr:DUF6442 family protein [Clostridium estertheticum]MBX4260417.1 hypothetical protein [Clostridium estertheticum]
MMKKEELLSKIKKTSLDEREDMIEGDSFGYGLITVFALVLIFSIWKMIHGDKSYELASIFAGYLATTSFYKFRKFQSKKFLVGGIIATASAIMAAIAFFLGA